MVTTRSLGSTLDRMITLNRAIDQAFGAGSRVWVPAIDVVEKKDAYELYADLPGVDASKVEIAFEQNVLTIYRLSDGTTLFGCPGQESCDSDADPESQP